MTLEELEKTFGQALSEMSTEKAGEVLNEIKELYAKNAESDKIKAEQDAKISDLQQQNIKLFLSQKMPEGANPNNQMKTPEQIQIEMYDKIIKSYAGQL